jgi:aerobic carbon-monoxide dehydrogenase large subunit
VPGSILGSSVRRIEDPELVRGRGVYVDDVAAPGALWLAFVRSPFAHARVVDVEADAARKSSGVVAVFASGDLPVPAFHPFFAFNDECMRPPLAVDRVRFVGDIVAVVVAESAAEAVDAVELVDVDYDPLHAEVDLEAALLPDATLQFDAMGTNVVAGERDPGGDGVLADAEVVVRVRIENQRMSVAPIEPNVVLVQVVDLDDRYDLVVHMSTQMPHGARRTFARVLSLDRERVRVVVPHVGGAFGGKAGVPVEHMIAAVVARRLERDVRWTETRSEAQLSMHGRGQVQYVELGLTRDGRFTGLRCRVVGDSGAYGGFGGAMAGGGTRLMAQGVYRIPRVAFESVAVMTNTAPMGALRGAGRPEAASMIERIVDVAADELGMDPVELRRRNLIGPGEFPYTTHTGATYDVGDYDLPLRAALRLADYDALLREQAARRERGDSWQLGVGVAAYVEVTGGGGEFGAVDVDGTGAVTVRAGTSAHGQGHATTFSMVASDVLGVPMEQVRFVQSDTARVPRGQGTGGSRSLQLGGSAVAGAAHLVLDQARALAARLLEAPESDVVLGDEGGFHVAGVPSAGVAWTDVAALAASDGVRLGADHDFAADASTFPFGAHVAVVEVDVETGRVRPLRLVAVDDCGRIVNPLVVAGQQHGGAAQGISQALWERFEYDDEGQPTTPTFAEYAIASAADLPPIEAHNTETPTPLNPLGAKGIGESATIGSTPAVQNAVVDAVSHLGVRHIDMPCTASRVWRAIEAAHAGGEEIWREPPAAFADLPIRAAGEESDEPQNI